ncbi:unknown [Akkermansia muciniphila CAG:154]|nr:unknown [Akkermansia muciniphila CAG:154]
MRRLPFPFSRRSLEPFPIVNMPVPVMLVAQPVCITAFFPRVMFRSELNVPSAATARVPDSTTSVPPADALNASLLRDSVPSPVLTTVPEMPPPSVALPAPITSEPAPLLISLPP